MSNQQSDLVAKAKDMVILWSPSRGRERITFRRPHTWFCLGVRGGGKSSFLERVGERYLDEGSTIVDLFGSRDGEGVAWLRSPYAETHRVLLLCGDNVDATAPCDVKHVGKLSLRDLQDYDVIVSANPLYSSTDNEFLSVNRIIDLLYKRRYYKKLVYAIIRESANLYYSRLRVSQNQLLAKAECTYMIREARHMGVATGLDTLKWTSTDIDIRSVTDYLVLKAQGQFMLPRSMRWIYAFIDFNYLRCIPVSNFVIVTRSGNIGSGWFPEVPWHKQERENILKAVGVKVEYGEEIELPESRGVFTTVGDEEHAKIISLYIEEDRSMHAIAKLLDRSSRTVNQHVKGHNESIEKDGVCLACQRMKSPHYIEKAIRGSKPKNP